MKSFFRNLIVISFALAILYIASKIIVTIAKHFAIIELIAELIVGGIIVCSIIMFIGWIYENSKRTK